MQIRTPVSSSGVHFQELLARGGLCGPIEGGLYEEASHRYGVARHSAAFHL